MRSTNKATNLNVGGTKINEGAGTGRESDTMPCGHGSEYPLDENSQPPLQTQPANNQISVLRNLQ